MRFHVCGPGPVGCLLGWHISRVLRRNVDALSMVIRPRHMKEIPYPRSPSIILRDSEGGLRVIGGFQLEAIRDVYAGPDVAFQNATEGLTPRSTCTHPPYGYIQSLFLTTKAHHAEKAIESLVAGGRISSATTIVLLHNGMGVYEQLVDTFFRNPETRPQFIVATNTHGALFEGMLDVKHTGEGQIHYGVVEDPLGRDQELSSVATSPPTENAPKDHETLYNPMPSSKPATASKRSIHSSASPPSAPHPQIWNPFYSLHRTIQLLDTLSPHLHVVREPMAELHHRAFRKLVTNCCINAITATKNYCNGAVISDPDARKTIRQVCEEAAAILQKEAEWIDEEAATMGSADETIFPSSGLAEETEEEREARFARIVNRMHFVPTPGADDLEKEVLRVVRLTTRNISSTLVDIRKGRKTEVEFINGYLSRLGREYGVSTPCNDWLADMVRQREAEGIATRSA